MKSVYEIVEIEDCNSDDDRIIVFRDMIFKELPPERNPEVLMRALEMACTRLRDIDWESSEAAPDGFIRLAGRELESEGRDGEQGA